MSEPAPPVSKYRLTVTIDGNSHDEIERELLIMTRGGYLHDSDRYARDEWHVIGGRTVRVMEHTNPDMTPERYEAELEVWWKATREARKAKP